MDIHDLKKLGYHVHVRHSRYFPGFNSPMSRREVEDKRLSWSNIEAKGGETEVEIYQGDTKVAEGYARCSLKDAYSKRAGRQWALKRALLGSLQQLSKKRK